MGHIRRSQTDIARLQDAGQTALLTPGDKLSLLATSDSPQFELQCDDTAAASGHPMPAAASGMGADVRSKPAAVATEPADASMKQSAKQPDIQRDANGMSEASCKPPSKR